jgi:hypothetical protein
VTEPVPAPRAEVAALARYVRFAARHHRRKIDGGDAQTGRQAARDTASSVLLDLDIVLHVRDTVHRPRQFGGARLQAVEFVNPSPHDAAFCVSTLIWWAFASSCELRLARRAVTVTSSIRPLGVACGVHAEVVAF